MPWALHRNLRYAISHDRGIFLDFVADRYFALPPNLDETVQAALSSDNGGLSREDPTCRRLAELNILSWQCEMQPNEVISPALSEIATATSPSIVIMVSLLAARRTASRDLQTKSLARIASDIAAPAHHGRARSRLENVVASDRWLRRLTRTHEQCLTHSLAFKRICSREGIAVKLILGVVAVPFAAHAWVQNGNVVLNDRLDYVRAFTPIAML